MLLTFFLPLRSNLEYLPDSAFVWRCVGSRAIYGANAGELAVLCFLIWQKMIEIGLRRAAIIPFSAVPCLDSVDFYACLTPVLSLTLNEDNSDRSETDMDTENWLYYTTVTNLALSSIERPELSFDFGCWTRGGVIFGIGSVIGCKNPGKVPVHWLSVLSISSAPVWSCALIGPLST